MSGNFTNSPATSTHNAYVILHACVSAFILLFGTLSNVIVMLTYMKFRRSMFETPRDSLIFSLAVGDFIASSLVAPLGMASSIAGKWISGRAGCVWYGFITTWIGLTSIVQLTGIAGERYYTLAHPAVRCTYICKKYTRLFAILAWIVSGIVSAFPIFGWSKYDFEGVGLYCSIVWSASTLNYGSYCLFLLVFFFVIPLGLIVYFYTNVYFVVRRISNDAQALWGVGDMVTKQSYIAQVKVARQLFVLTGMFVFAWTPYAVMSFFSVTNIIKPDKQTSTLPSLFAKLSNICNPVIYFFTFKRLRRRSFQLFKSSVIE